MEHKTVAVDIAKDVFEIAVSDKPGRVLQRKRVTRSRFLKLFANLPPSSWRLVGRPISGVGSSGSWDTALSCCLHTWSVPIAVTTNTIVPTPRLSLNRIGTRKSSRFPSRVSGNRYLRLYIDCAQPGWTLGPPVSIPFEGYYESSDYSFPKGLVTSYPESTSLWKTPNRDYPML